MRSRIVFAASAVITVLMFMPALTRAADAVTDPRAYCDRAVEMLTTGNIDELTSDLLAHSNGTLSGVEFKAAMAGFEALPVKAGRLRLHEHASEWKVGEAFVRHQYILIYDYTPLFLRCTMYSPNKQWLLLDFTGNTDPERVGFRQ